MRHYYQEQSCATADKHAKQLSPTTVFPDPVSVPGFSRYIARDLVFSVADNPFAIFFGSPLVSDPVGGGRIAAKG